MLVLDALAEAPASYSSRMEADCSPDTLQHGTLEVVVQEYARSALEKLKRIDVARTKLGIAALR
jgi:hypothetical protein